ncbi:unnamed protein product [Phytophthora fragariaefolia]|uniref:Unnamed protein product n=1 Tax=Phytophthora fragariaefolia TaxID=1490495 RepID=A0A9W6YCY4_9STRA|nr:unnamed protein product [Phytophthora fragariaefolia]
MYPDVNNQAIATDEYFANRTILTTTNVMVRRINDAVAARLDGDAHEYRSIDKLQDDEDWNFFEPEILNSVNINGILLQGNRSMAHCTSLEVPEPVNPNRSNTTTR